MMGPAIAVGADPSEWLARYKRLMGNAIAYTLYNTSPDRHGELWWRAGEAGDGGAPQVFERVITTTRDQMYGGNGIAEGDAAMYLVKAIVRGRADRYAYIVSDFDPETRLAWDSDALAACQQMETYHSTPPEEGDIHVCQMQLRSCQRDSVGMGWVLQKLLGTWRGSPNHGALGIFTRHYTAATATHSVYFTTAPHYHYGETSQPQAAVTSHPLPEATVFSMHAAQLDDGTCELTLFVRVPLQTVAVSAAYLQQRVHQYERVVDQWDRYYGPLRDPKKYRK